MKEFFRKTQAQVIACMLILCCSFALSFYCAMFGVSVEAERIINKVTDICLVGVVGWLFTQNKNNGSIKQDV